MYFINATCYYEEDYRNGWEPFECTLQMLLATTRRTTVTVGSLLNVLYKCYLLLRGGLP